MNTRSRSAAKAKEQSKAKDIKKTTDEIESGGEVDKDKFESDGNNDDDDEPEYVPKSTGRKAKQPVKKETKPRGRKSQAKVVAKEKPIEEKSKAVEEDVVIYYELSEKEMKEVNHAFEMNHPDSDESLNADGLRTAMRSLGFEPRGDEIQKLIRKFATKKGKVNRDGFHKIMSLKYSSSPSMINDANTKDEISRVFNLLDLDKTGFITIDNLRSIAKELNEELDDEELMEMIQEADSDGDKKITKEDFQEIMKKTNLY